MSEKFDYRSRTSTPDIDSSDVNMAFDPEARQAQQDWSDYLKTRDSMDDKGNIHDASSGKFKSASDGESLDDYHDHMMSEVAVEAEPEGLKTLANVAREALESGDKTKYLDTEDEIQSRIISMSVEKGWTDDQTERMLGRVMKIIYAKYQKDTGNTQTSESNEAKIDDGTTDEPAVLSDSGESRSNDQDSTDSHGSQADAGPKDEDDASADRPKDPTVDSSADSSPAGGKPAQEVVPWTRSRTDVVPVSASGTSLERSGGISDILRDARNNFIQAKIDLETHFFKKWFGGKARSEKLTSTRDTLASAEIADAKAALEPAIARILAEAERNGNFNADSLKRMEAQLIAAYTFTQANNLEVATADAYDNMLDERTGVRKISAKIGGWFTNGGKLAKWLKGGGTGLVAGAGVMLAGATIPITVVAGVSSKIAVGLLSREALIESHQNEDRSLDESIGQDLMQTLVDSNGSRDSDIESAVQSMLTRSEIDSKERQSALKSGVRGAMARYAIGYAVGSVIGANVHSHLVASHGTPSGNNPNGGGNAQQAPGQTELHNRPSGFNGPHDTAGAGETASAPHAPLPDVSGDTISVPTPDFANYHYPWNWAADQFGNGGATSALQELVKSTPGAEWHNLVNGAIGNHSWISFNGASDTPTVLKALYSTLQSNPGLVK